MWAQSCVVVVALVVVTSAAGPQSQLTKCSDKMQCTQGQMEATASKCTAEWGAFPRVNPDTNQLLSQQLQHSFEYLLMASHFKNWQYNRPGFAAYFTKLSDENWQEALDLLLHMVERGGTLSSLEIDMSGVSAQPAEIEALSKALDLEKKVAHKTLHLAHLANHGANVPHDSEFAEFLAKRLHKNSVLRIKHLANYVNLFHDMLNGETDAPHNKYAIFKFDSEYLK